MCGREEKATEGELIYEGQTNILITDYKIWHSVPLLFLFPCYTRRPGATQKENLNLLDGRIHHAECPPRLYIEIRAKNQKMLLLL